MNKKETLAAILFLFLLCLYTAYVIGLNIGQTTAPIFVSFCSGEKETL